MNILFSTASFAGVIALMIVAIIFEILSVVVKVAGALLEKKLDILVGVFQLFAGKTFDISYA